MPDPLIYRHYASSSKGSLVLSRESNKPSRDKDQALAYVSHMSQIELLKPSSHAAADMGQLLFNHVAGAAKTSSVTHW